MWPLSLSPLLPAPLLALVFALASSLVIGSVSAASLVPPPPSFLLSSPPPSDSVPPVLVSDDRSNAPLSSSCSEARGSSSCPHALSRRGNYAGFDDPRPGGGQMLTFIDVTYPQGLGEPLNIILSADSDKAVLVDSDQDGGFRNYALSLNFGAECLNVLNPGGQRANLGDGQGELNQTAELRYNFGDIYFGTCRETIQGGGHFRYWTQKNTGAYFIAASIEQDLASGHDIVYNGYDLGRDEVISYATYGVNSDKFVETRNVTNQTTFEGTSTFNNFTYLTSTKYISGLLANSSDGINHYLTVEEDGLPAIDGLVAVMTVKITDYPPDYKKKSSAWRSIRGPSSVAVGLVGVLCTLAGLAWTLPLA